MWVCRLGRVPYRDGLLIQNSVADRRREGRIPDTLLLLEHDPVYTLGRRASSDELTLGERFYRERGIDVVRTDRGGKVTYHGPGQLVGYPIMEISHVVSHVRAIEAAIVGALAELGVQARSRGEEGPEWTGVWVEERKIASVGVHVSRGITTHGFAVNVLNDMEPFTWVVPCGLAGVQMTSVAQELAGEPPGVEAFGDLVAGHLCDARSITPRAVSPELAGAL